MPKPFMIYGLIICLFFAASCSETKENAFIVSNDLHPVLNFNHLDHLYTQIQLPGDVTAGIIHIYSEYPDYVYEIEDDEGYTCVDDVARVLVLMTRVQKNKLFDVNEKTMEAMKDFILYMQAENGYFYNFLWGDLTINTTYQTTRAEPNWWSWRALWALESYLEIWDGKDNRIEEAIDKVIWNVKQEYLDKPAEKVSIEGLNFPTWLPFATASDQAALLIIGLEKYYNRTGDEEILKVIRKFADGILLMQYGDPDQFPYGAFLSWKNIWHAYGNAQAYSMFKAGKLLGEQAYIDAAILEVDHYYPWLIKKGFLSHWTITGENLQLDEEARFAQIAYGIRPMVFACLEAYNMTGNPEQIKRAEEIASWLSGSNPASQVMFDPRTGRCYDGIVSPEKVNLNSGAESTVEAMLAIEAIISHPVANIENVYAPE